MVFVFGIPVLMMDIKGDFSGIAKEGEVKSFITERHEKINIPYNVAPMHQQYLSVVKKVIKYSFPNKKEMQIQVS